jgi:hypothetical protein
MERRKKPMEYAKPEVGVLGFASDAIQGTMKYHVYVDSEALPTAGAYEAQE